MRILITGAEGNLGTELMRVLGDEHDVSGVDLPELDITDFAAVRQYVEGQQPDLIINPAAWTDVDACARDPEKAILINGYGAQNVALAAHEVSAAMMQISSNEVFDGTASRPYREYDDTATVNPYAYSKLVGERAVQQVNPRHYIVRTSWLVSHGGRNFIHAILGAAEAGKSLRVVVDEVANPTYTPDLAAAIAQLIATGRYGVYHLCNAGAASRYDFARYALDRAGYTDTPLTKISRHQWPRPSTPPMYSSLANIHAARLGITLRHWQAAIDAFLAQEGLLRA